MSVYIPRPLYTPEKAILGQGAGAMQTLLPLAGMIRNPQQMMRMAEGLYHSDKWVYKAEQTIDFAFSTVDWHLEDADDNEIDAETATGPALDALNLLEKPQAILTGRQPMTRSQLWSITARHMGLCGSAFWLADQREGLAGTPLALLYIAPWRMTAAEDDAGNLTGWVLDAKATGYGQTSGIPLRLDEIYHFKLNEPSQGHFGIGNVEAALTTTMLTKLSDGHAADVLASGGRLAGIVSAKAGGTIPDGVYQQMIRDFRTINDQPDSARHMAVIQGPVEFTKTTATPAELDLLKLMTLSRDDTLAIWGVPFTQIGGAAPAGLSSGDVRKYDRAALWQNAIHPRLTNFWEVIQFQLLDRYQKLGAVIELEIEEPEFEDDSPRYDFLQKSINIAMTNAERRALIGLDPLGDPAMDDAIFLPVTLSMVSTAPNAGPAANPSQQALGRAQPDQAEQPGDQASAAAGETAQGKARLPNRASRIGDSLRTLKGTVDKSTTPKLQASVAAFLADQKREIIARVRSLPTFRLKDPAHVFPQRVMDDWDARLAAVMKPHIATIASVVAGHVAEVVPTGKAGPTKKRDGRVIVPVGTAAALEGTTSQAMADAYLEAVTKRVLLKGAARVTGITGTTRDLVMGVIRSTVADNLDMGMAELGGVLETALGDAAAFDTYRSEMIARTETGTAWNEAAVDSYRESGIEMIQVLDGDQDDECAPWADWVGPIDDGPEPLGHPNCTRDVLPYFE